MFAKIHGIFSAKTAARNKSLANQKEQLKKLDFKLKKRIWIHCASLGEFEMAIPLIEKWKENQLEIIVSFFSPSGFENRKNYPGITVFYLPYDIKSSVVFWLKYVKPDAVIFVKYDFWKNYIQQILKSKIPIYFINANFYESHFIFKWYGSKWRALLYQCTQLFVLNNEVKKRLETFLFSNVTVAGDTRYDRVLQICNEAKSIKEIEQFLQNKPLLILGSSWPDEEGLLLNFLQENHIIKNWKIIITPHDVSTVHIDEIKEKFNQYNPALFSEFEGKKVETNLLIIDTIGLLNRVYSYAQIAVIGGAFGKGLHNILEAATYGMPIIFGPNINKFPEADLAIKNGFGFVVNNQFEFNKTLTELISNTELISIAKNKSKEFISSHSGATEIIFNQIIF